MNSEKAELDCPSLCKNTCNFGVEGLDKLINDAHANILLCKHTLYFIRSSEINMGDLIGKSV